mmetsp:Transcript_8871/g.27728  ORF Transcript_8871/g.27728 Transcript_8871/m.27728 type:complete len:292 (-) Transcript_8871:106-981(-)
MPVDKAGDLTSTTTVAFWASIILYSLFSSSMLLVNKLTLSYLAFPSTVSFIQIIAAVAIIRGASVFNLLGDVDALEKDKVMPYLFYVVLFALALLANMKSLQHANVETVIVFRSLTPAAVALLDPAFLERDLPSPRSWLALAVIVAGAAAYAFEDAQFHEMGLSAYAWPTFYLVIIATEMTYGKLIVHAVDMKSRIWGPTYYTNALSSPVMLFLVWANGEATRLSAGPPDVEPAGLLLLGFSCVVGTGISFAGWWCRSQTSATTYTLVGVMNKFLTILANVMVRGAARGPL